MEFVLIQPGSFMMGSKTGYSSEEPVHQVRISNTFYLGKYEVTQAQWQVIMEKNPGRFKGDPNLPVESVLWDDVQEFIRRLNAREGGGRYRLPTEAEWEYAARAGGTTAYSFGDNEGQLRDYAWYGENSNNKTWPVGQKRANAWGLHDMHGNVWELVQDWYGTYASAAVTDPQGPRSGPCRVLRGGSWRYDARGCRSANRDCYAHGYLPGTVGVRLLKTVP
jgi:formylglycine-generating enzyme required for sulfatase activity